MHAVTLSCDAGRRIVYDLIRHSKKGVQREGRQAHLFRKKAGREVIACAVPTVDSSRLLKRGHQFLRMTHSDHFPGAR
jgi:hypothetical protein